MILGLLIAMAVLAAVAFWMAGNHPRFILGASWAAIFLGILLFYVAEKMMKYQVEEMMVSGRDVGVGNFWLGISSVGMFLVPLGVGALFGGAIRTLIRCLRRRN